jgi:hypothetical protein
MESFKNINYKGIKPKETIWVTYFDINHNLSYCITSDIYRDNYYLYKYDLTTNIWNNTKKKSNDPLDFDTIIKSDLFSDKNMLPINNEIKSTTNKNKQHKEIKESNKPVSKETKSTNLGQKKRGRPPKNKLF